MNTKDLVLGVFVIATVVFAALTVNEYTQGQAPSNSTVVSTITLISTSTIIVYTTGSIGSSNLAATQTFVTGTSVTTSNTYITQCSITGIGGFQLRVVSDSTGAPVSGETINAVDRLGCDVGQTSQTQIVYLNDFSQGQGGWLTPVFPSQAPMHGGQLNFTVSYQGGTYNFSSLVPPVGTTCVTLHVPSGSLTSTTMMSGFCT
jgi:hypothetical protein